MQPGAPILALDLASVCGWAEGPLPARGAAFDPSTVKYGAHRFAPAGATSEYVGAKAVQYFADRFRVFRPSVLAIEEPELWRSKTRTTTKATLRRLWGLSFTVAACAAIRGVSEFHYCNAEEARRVLLGTGQRRMSKDEALPRVMAACRAIGWDPPCNDSAAALAVWIWTAEQVLPGSMVNALPIFVGGKAVRVAR